MTVIISSNIISIFRGDSRTIQFKSKKKQTDGTYTDYNFTGCTIALYIKRKVKDLNANAVITLSGNIVDVNTVEFYFVASTTNNATTLINEKVYPFDIQVTTASGKVYTALRGSFVVLQP